MMDILKRSIVNVSLFPVGSSYRLRIPLPSAGECWFTVDTTQDISSFLQELKEEDKSIKSVHSEDASKLFIEAAEEGIQLSINSTQYSLRKTASAESIDSQSMISAFMNKLESSEITSKKELDVIVNRVLTELGEQFGTYLSVLRNSVDDIDNQIKLIEKKEDKIMKLIKYNSNVYCGGMLSFLSMQWAFFYYTIYGVDWLGWDLMEPITFTLGQASFVISLWYFLRTQTSHSYENMLYRYESKRKIYMLKNAGIDIGRIKFLTEEKRRIQSLIEVIEKRLV